MEHHAAVTNRPARASGGLLAYKPIFDSKSVLRVHAIVEQMAKAFIKFFVAVVADLDHPILDTESIAIVFTEFETTDFGSPTREVFAIEERNPFPFLFVG